MKQRNSTVQALVPFVSSKKSFVSVFSDLRTRFAVKTDMLFQARKKLYFVFTLIACFGFLLGAYYSSLHGGSVETTDFLQFGYFLTIFVFVTSMTVFGVVVVPLSLLLFSFAYGMQNHFMLLTPSRAIPLFILILFFSFLLVLFFSEAFYSSKHSFAGVKCLIFKKTFILHILFFLLCILMNKGIVCLLILLS